MTRTQGWARALATVGVVVLVDQATKQLAATRLDRGESIDVFFGIDLTNTRNQGVAFGALGDAGGVIAILIGAALVLLLTYFALNAARAWLWLPVGLLLGGALGNLADRARGGGVIDFIDPILWPVFNLADVAIVIGVFALLYVIDRQAAAG
jgi:signal peptidase II